ncbi:hypothetical protein D3C81_1362530 [compost metagenome]
MQFNVFDIRLVLGTMGLGVDVHAAFAAPDAGHGSKRAEVVQRVGIRRRLGVDVFREIRHEAGLALADCCLWYPCLNATPDVAEGCLGASFQMNAQKRRLQQSAADAGFPMR